MSAATEYRDLLTEFAPRPIRSAADYHRALAQLEKLMVPHPGAARSLLIEVLATLIEKYESRDFPTPRLSPSKMLAKLMESKSVRPADVAKATKIPAATLSNVLADRRGISKQNAIKLGEYFGVSALVFLPTSENQRQSTRAS